jgi:hypothetical protein
VRKRTPEQLKKLFNYIVSKERTIENLIYLTEIDLEMSIEEHECSNDDFDMGRIDVLESHLDYLKQIQIKGSRFAKHVLIDKY